MFSCRDISEKATEYQEGELSWLQRLNWRLHLLMCRDCRRFVRQFQLMIAALGRSEPVVSDAEIDSQLKRLDQGSDSA